MFVQTGKLVFKSYKPLKLEKGMYFLIRRNNEMVINMLDYIPMNQDDYLQMNGYPVEPYIIHPGNPNIADDGYVIATPEEIGWWDEGEHTDDLYDVTIKELNNIIELYDGDVNVEVEEFPDERGNPVTILVQGQVIMSYDDDYEEEEEEYFFDDDEEYTPDEDWDNNIINQNNTYDKDEK